MGHRASRIAALLLLACTPAPSNALAQQPAANPAAAQDFAAEFEALLGRFQAAQKAHMALLQALYDGFDEAKASESELAALEKRRAELDLQDPSPAFLKEFVALAERAKGTPVAAKALMQVLSLDRKPPRAADNQGCKALATLLAEHILSPELEELPMILQYAPSIDRKLRCEAYGKLASASPLEQVQATSLFFLAMELTVDEARGGDKAKARGMFVDLKTRFGAMKSPMGKTYAAHAEGFLYELDHLQLGMQAPDFEATDENGVKFRLSDYLGKVVVVDFWGDW